MTSLRHGLVVSLVVSIAMVAGCGGGGAQVERTSRGSVELVSELGPWTCRYFGAAETEQSSFDSGFEGEAQTLASCGTTMIAASVAAGARSVELLDTDLNRACVSRSLRRITLEGATSSGYRVRCDRPAPAASATAHR